MYETRYKQRNVEYSTNASYESQIDMYERMKRYAEEDKSLMKIIPINSL